jgi:DnaJ-class molecular chaperone
MSKRDYYEVLGLTKSATDDDIKKAYRRLSSAHHPDKHTDPAEKAKHEAVFKEVKEAYEALSDPQKREVYDAHGHQEAGFQEWSSTSMDDLLNILRRARAGFGRTFRQVSEVKAVVTLKEAHAGFDFTVALPDGSTKRLPIPPGSPDGYRSQHDISPSISLVVTVSIQDPHFTVKNATECGWRTEAIGGRQVVVIETGDVETTTDVDALDILTGAWVQVSSFEGDALQVRVPAGFNLNQRLKVKGRGTYHWAHDLNRAHGRGDLYVKVSPVFKAPKDLDLKKVKDLLQQVAAYQPPGS